MTDSRRIAVPDVLGEVAQQRLGRPLQAEVGPEPSDDVVGGGSRAVHEAVHAALEPQPCGLDGHRDDPGPDQLAEPVPGTTRVTSQVTTT